MRWGRLIKDVEHWFDTKIIPLLGDDPITMAKVKEEYKEFKHAVEMVELHDKHSQSGEYLSKQEVRVLHQHVEAEAADLFIALLCYCHANDINLKRAVYATYLKLQKRKWKKTNIPGLVRHVDE